MLIYISLLNFYLFASIIEKFSLRKKIRTAKFWRFWIILISIPIFLMIAFRDISVGNDTRMYYAFYSAQSLVPLRSAFDYTYMEKLFVIIANIISHTGASYYTFQFVIALFSCVLFGRYIYEYSINYSLSWYFFITLLFMSRTMNISRQMLAVAISVLSFRNIMNKKYFKFIFTSIVAAYIHKSAIMQLAILPLIFIKKDINRKFLILILSSLSLFFFNNLLSLITTIFSRYSHFLESEYMDVSGGLARYFNILFIVMILILFNIKEERIISVMNETKLDCLDQAIYKFKIMDSYLLLSFLYCVIGLNFGLADRASLYFLLPLILIIPIILYAIRPIKNRILITEIFIFGTYLYFIFINIYRNEWNTIIPYKFRFVI